MSHSIEALVKQATAFYTTRLRERAARHEADGWEAMREGDPLLLKQAAQHIDDIAAEAARALSSLQHAAAVRDETVAALTGTVTDQQFKLSSLQAQVEGLREALNACIDDIIAAAVFEGTPKFEAERSSVVTKARTALSLSQSTPADKGA